jgi:hypothetical protein
MTGPEQPLTNLSWRALPENGLELRAQLARQFVAQHGLLPPQPPARRTPRPPRDQQKLADGTSAAVPMGAAAT